MVFKDFILALGKALGVTLIVGGITLIIGRALWIRWSRRWQFKIKYDLMKAKVDPIKAEWIIEALKRGMDYNKMKMKLLIAGFKDPDVHEMLWLANKISKETGLKGGQDGRERQFKRVDSKNESRKLPNHISSY